MPVSAKSRQCRWSCRLFVLLALSGATAVQASGQDGPGMPPFVAWWGPPGPLEHFAQGELGVVERSWWRGPLLLAWFRMQEQDVPSSVVPALIHGTPISAGPQLEEAVEQWRQAAEKAAPDLFPERDISPHASLPGPGWDMFENCPSHAWLQATSTLQERSRAWGSGSPALRDWLVAQHQVFARCAMGPAPNPVYAEKHALPEMDLADPAGDAPLLLHHDRQYQRAAALLYEGDYTTAEAAFISIAEQADSPWKPWARYLALRARFRNIDVTPETVSPARDCAWHGCENQADRWNQWLAPQRQQLMDDLRAAIVESRDSGSGDETDRLEALQALAGARLDPLNRMRELGARLQAGPDAYSKTDLRDFLMLHRRYPAVEPIGEWLNSLITPGFLGRPEVCSPEGQPLNHGFQYDSPAVQTCRRRHHSKEAFARYEAHGQLPWLFTAAVFAESDDPLVEQLREALSKVPDAHPAAATFLLQRLRLASGNEAEAEALTQTLLSRPEASRDASARNRVHEYRMRHAHNIEEFWLYAQREHVRQYDWDTRLAVENRGQPLPDLDSDTDWVLNYALPLSILLETAERAPWPENLRRRVASRALDRALLLGDVHQVRRALRLLLKLSGASSSPLSQLGQITDDQQFMLEAGLVHYPGLCRQAAPESMDPYSWEDTSLIDWPGKHHRDAAETLLDEAQLAEWRQEREKLEALPPSTNLIMRHRVDFAARFPADPRVPGLLREAVYAPRMNYCGDDDSGPLSRRAFQLLKRGYPNSSEARETKYWFKPEGSLL